MSTLGCGDCNFHGSLKELKFYGRVMKYHGKSYCFTFFTNLDSQTQKLQLQRGGENRSLLYAW